MKISAPQHRLTQVDIEKMMAVCSVCGPTDIWKRTVNKRYAAYICNTKKRAYAHEYKIAHYIRKQRKPREPKPPRQLKPRGPESQHRRPYKPRQFGHVLSEIDENDKTAICLTCGRVRITILHSKRRTIRRYGKAQDQYHRNLHNKNQAFILQYLVERGCKRCGYNTDPYKLGIHSRNLYEKDLKLSRLIVMFIVLIVITFFIMSLTFKKKLPK